MSDGISVAVQKKTLARSLVGLLAALIGIGLVALLDWSTGVEISASIFYLVPIGLAVWFAGWWGGVCVSIIAAAVWLLLDVRGGDVYSRPYVPYWNALVRLGFFLLTTFLLDRVRALKTSVNERTAALAAEVEIARESEARFRQLTENIKEIFWMTDLDKTRMIYVGLGYEEVWGRSRESLYASPRNWAEAIHADDRERVLAAALTKQASGQYDEVYRIVRPDGSLRWIHDRAFPIRDESGNVYRIGGIAEDVSTQRQAEAHLSLQSAALEASADAIVLTDCRGTVIWANLAFTELTGYSVTEVLGQNVRLLKSGQQDQSFYHNLWQTILAGQVWQGEMVNRRKDGSFYAEENTITPVRDQRGEITHFIAVKRDITERKRSEVRLATLAHAVESTAEPICITDLEQRFTFVNGAFQQIYGYTEADILGRTSEAVYSPNNPPGLLAEIRAQTRLGGWRGEIVGRRKDGTDVLVFLSTSQIESKAGEVLGFMAVAQDITERKKAEKQSAVFGRLGHKLSAAAQPKEAARIILDMASELFGWDAGYLHLYSRAEDRIVPILTVDTVNGQRTPVPDVSFTFDPSPLMRRVMDAGAQLINRMPDAPPAVPLTPFGDMGRPSASMMYVPIHFRGTVLGVLSIQSYAPQAYSEDDLKLLHALADHCGNALERIKTTEALREAEAKYHSIFDNATEGIFQATRDGRCFNANPALARIFGYQSPAELITTVTNIEQQTFVSAEDAGELRRLLATQDHVVGFETEQHRKDGGKCWTSVNVRAVRDAGGGLLYYEGTVRDITERKRVESALRENEERFRTLFESSPLGIALQDSNGRILQTNRAYQRLLGYTGDELRERGVKRITHPDDVAEGQQLYGELCDGTRERYQREKRYRRKDGSVIWGQSSVAALRDDTGQLRQIISIVEDITGRRRMVETLRQLAAIVESSQDAIVSATMDGTIVSWNQAAERMFGYRAGEALGQSIALTVTSDRVAEQAKAFSDLVAGKVVKSFETVRRRKDGTLIHVFLTVSLMRDANGKVTGISTIASDVTERKRLEREVMEISASERRRIGHDLHDELGQCLTAIAFRTKALERKLASAGGQYAQEANEVIGMISNAIAQTRRLARGLDPVGIETIGLVAALQVLAAETEEVFNLTCRFHCADTTLSVDGQKALALYRIVQEAIHNAITHGEARQITIELAMDTDHLCLRVRDDGAGFAPGTGNLRGMGLRVMQFRARSIEARLEINSQINHGTEIRCLLPHAACTPASPDAGTGA